MCSEITHLAAYCQSLCNTEKLTPQFIFKHGIFILMPWRVHVQALGGAIVVQNYTKHFIPIGLMFMSCVSMQEFDTAMS